MKVPSLLSSGSIQFSQSQLIAISVKIVGFNCILISLLVVPKLNHLSLLSISFSQTFVPAIIHLASSINKQQESGRRREEIRRKSEANSEQFKREDFEVPKKNTWQTVIVGFFRALLVLIAILHFVLIGYNCYVQNLDVVWIAILYAYIIWSSIKYGANYMQFKDESAKDVSKQSRTSNGELIDDKPTSFRESNSWIYWFFPEPNWTKDQLVETQYMRSFIASLLHIISKLISA